MMPGTRRSRWVVFLLISILTPVPSVAQLQEADSAPDSDAKSFKPNILPRLTIPRAQSPVRIDGELDESIWSRAARAVNFSENFPDEMTEPPIGIEVRAAYDDHSLYLAYLIEDDPDEIRANFSDRDQIWSDDYVGMLLDTIGDTQQTYFIAANPFGIQGDTFISPNGEDASFNLIFESAGRLSENGYVVEMAIPFKSLRFPEARVQSWRATFWITHPRDSRNVYTWAAIDRDDPCFQCQFGYLEGLEGVHAGKNLEVLPSVTGSQSGAVLDAEHPRSSFDNDRLTAEPSLNIKYGITSDLTADLTVNPDFSQIESDAAQIDINSTFALYYPERRTFFQEGSDLFQTAMQTVYTRSINDPILANKMTGRFGNTSIGYIGARDSESPLLLPFEESSRLVSGGKSFSNILRVRHSFSNSSFLGALVTDRRLDAGGAGSTFGLDGSVRFLTNYTVQFQAVASRTAELDDAQLSEAFSDLVFDGGRHTAAFDGETFLGHALTGSFGRAGRHWGFDVTYREFSPTFRADNGFITQNAVRTLMAFQNYTFYPEIPLLDRVTPQVFGSKSWNWENVVKDETLGMGVSVQMKRQTRIFVQVTNSRELFADRVFSGIVTFHGNLNSNFSERVQFGFNASLGDAIARNVEAPFIGRSTNLGAHATLRPTARLVLSPQISFSELRNPSTNDRVFTGYILRSRVNYQFTRKLLARVIVQYNEFSESLALDPLITYRVNSFTVFHVGSTHRFDTYTGQMPGDPNVFAQSSRQVFFKAQYLFRR